MPVEFIRLTAAEFESLPKEKTVFFFPVGPLEDHGPHLPLGLDPLVAQGFSEQVAIHLEKQMEGWVGVLMPALPLGIEANTSGLKLTVRAHVLRDWLVDACQSLMKRGFYHFVCFSGHLGPKQLTAIEDAGKLIQRAARWKKLSSRLGKKGPVPNLLSGSSALIRAQDVLRSPLWPDPLEHGGRIDTSLALVFLKDQLNFEFQGLPERKREALLLKRLLKRVFKKIEGYWGNPSLADPEAGRAQIQKELQVIFPRLQAVLEGAPAGSWFRSWYSILPMNKSFFRIWILFFLILIVLSGWVYLTFSLFPGAS
ncbi:MAG: creatininase family protein [Bdellovibrionia bacterium]